MIYERYFHSRRHEPLRVKIKDGRLKSPTFGILRGSLNNGALWIESADGLASAVKLMNECARKHSGPYIVFDFQAYKVLATTDTSPHSKRKPPKRRTPERNKL
jgi:hypothetical protein